MKNKKNMEIPHSLVIIVVVMFLATLLTYIIPAGSYARVESASGQTMVDPASFQYVEQTPVKPLKILDYVCIDLYSCWLQFLDSICSSWTCYGESIRI